MRTYRALLRQQAATRTPWRADTLFGHLCWQLRYTQGAAALADLLARYRAGAPPLLFSDGFPAGWLPHPLLPAVPSPAPWLSEGEFAALRQGDLPAARPAELRSGRVVLRQPVGRLSDAEAPAGGYYVAELAYTQAHGGGQAGLDVAVFVRAADAAWAAQAEAWLAQLAHGGYGAGKSAGFGQVALAEFAPWPAFDTAPPGANGFVSLASWVPARADPTEGFYATQVKYGKLGEALAHAANPYKYPLVQLVAGSCFYAPAPIRPWYGRLVEPIAELAEPPVVQYGFAFPVAMWLAPG